MVRFIWALEWVFLECISGHMKEEKVTGNCQCGFTRSKSCLNNLIAFLDKMTDLWVRGE